MAGICTEGVKVVRDLFLHNLQHGEVHFKISPDEEQQALSLNLRPKLDAAAMKLLRLR